jgi:hypothetical protein
MAVASLLIPIGLSSSASEALTRSAALALNVIAVVPATRPALTPAKVRC